MYLKALQQEPPRGLSLQEQFQELVQISKNRLEMCGEPVNPNPTQCIIDADSKPNVSKVFSNVSVVIIWRMIVQMWCGIDVFEGTFPSWKNMSRIEQETLVYQELEKLDTPQTPGSKDDLLGKVNSSYTRFRQKLSPNAPSNFCCITTIEKLKGTVLKIRANLIPSLSEESLKKVSPTDFTDKDFATVLKETMEVVKMVIFELSPGNKIATGATLVALIGELKTSVDPQALKQNAPDKQFIENIWSLEKVLTV